MSILGSDDKWPYNEPVPGVVEMERMMKDYHKRSAEVTTPVPGVIAKPEAKSPRVNANGKWLASLSHKERKECAVSRGFFAYFADAIALVARHSVRMNEKHNPGQPVHWSRDKSSDHEDCIARHSLAVSINPDAMDDGQPEIVCRAWRAMAALQEWAERQKRDETGE